MSVPGAFELPQAARSLAETGRFDAVICLGCVIRGATPHFEYISASVAHGIQDASGGTGVPMAFGVLTTDTWEQAEERAGRRPGQQGIRGRGRGDRDGAAVSPPAPDEARRLRLVMTRVDAAGRRRARASALQMLYQAEVGRMGPQEAIGAFWRLDRSGDVEPEEAREEPDEPITDDCASSRTTSCARRSPASRRSTSCSSPHAHNWRLERMAVIDRLVLRLAVCELLTHPETPPKVVINEALELARTFSGDEAVAFVNGVLDAVRKALPA